MQRLSNIVDVNGRSISVKESLRDEQTSRVGFISREFEGHPTRGLTPLKLANILSSAEQGDITEQCDLFEDMEEKDGHIFAELSKRKRAILGVPWDLVPPRDASTAELTATERTKEWLEDMDDFPDYLFDIADAIGKGFSNLAISWNQLPDVVLPTLEHKPARWFTVDQDNRDKLLLRTSSGMGEELWPFGWVSHVHKAKSGYITRAGLHRVLAWPFLFKNFSVRDLAEFLEIYGIPARLGTYPSGATEEEKMTLLRAVVSIGHNAAGIMPEGMQMDFKEAAKGASDPFDFMINWCESIQSKVILGGTLTTTAESTGLGSGLGDVHNEVRHDLLISDVRQIAGTLTRDLVWPMVALNIPGIDPRRAPRFKFITDDEEDLVQRSSRDKTLFDMGFRLTEDKVKEVYGEGYERIPGPERPYAGQVIAKAAAKQDDQQVEEIDGFVAQLATETQSDIDALYLRIKTLLAEVNSLEEFQDRLVEAYSYMEPDALADVIQFALSAADLAGRYEVAENDN